MKEENRKRRRRKQGKEGVSLSQCAMAGAPISVRQDNPASVVVPALLQGKRKRTRVMEQEQSSQSPLPFDVHPLGGKEVARSPKCQNVAVRHSSKMRRMPSNRQILRTRIEAKKQRQLPERLLDALREAAEPSTNSTENNSNNSSPGVFFDQFRYKPDHWQNCKPVPTTAALLKPVEEAETKKEKRKQIRWKHRKEGVSPSQCAVAGAPISVHQDKTACVVAPAPAPASLQGKRERTWVMEQEQSSQSPLPFDVHPLGGKEAAQTPKCQNVDVRCSSKVRRMPSNHQILRTRIEGKKQLQRPEGLLDTLRKEADPSTNSTENNSNNPSLFVTFFDQFCYKPDHRQNCKHVPTTAYCPARSPPRGCLSVVPSQLGANGTSKVTKTPVVNASVSLSQEVVQAKDGKTEMTDMIKKRKPMLRTAEKKSDIYRRLPLDQLVIPPRSPHKLLQEKYASDPWKVIVICMLLNLTQGKQVRKKVKGFFKRYPDPQTACRADPVKMAEYLAPLGLQQVKTKRIQRLSKDYVEKEWTYITELCGVGKYAADAYAIFCAGRATEVVPEDHKLVDYWKYVCTLI